MRFPIITWACACVAGVAANNPKPGILGVHAVFPRNDTYSPADAFPVVFAFSKPELLPFIPLSIDLSVLDRDNTTAGAYFVKSSRIPILPQNLSTSDEPWVEYFGLTTFKREGRWRIYWNLIFGSCDEDDTGEWDMTFESFSVNRTTGFIDFTTKNSTTEVDLVAATSNEENCPSDAVALNVTKIVDLTIAAPFSWRGDSARCGALGPSAINPDPCQIKINATLAAEVNTKMAEISRTEECLRESTEECRRWLRGESTSAAHKAVAGGWMFWIASALSFGYILVVFV